MMPRHTSQTGFTLVEAIVVMVIVGIIGGMIAIFLKAPVQNYVDLAGRAELTDVADTAVRRIAREVRLAVPNTVRVSGTSIEFMPSKSGGRYLSAEDNVAGDHLNFIDSSDRTFYVVGPMLTGVQQILPNDYIVVNNLGPGFAPADVYATPATNRAQVTAVDIANKIVTLGVNSFVPQNPLTPAMAHALHRFQVASAPVTFRCDGGTLFRHTGYGFNAGHVAVPAGGTVSILATNVQSCQFDYLTIANTRTALVRAALTLRRAAGTDGAVTLVQQIHVDNTP